jgi:hypothetical protein
MFHKIFLVSTIHLIMTLFSLKTGSNVTIFININAYIIDFIDIRQEYNIFY